MIEWYKSHKNTLFGSPKWSSILKASSLWDQQLVEVGIDLDYHFRQLEATNEFELEKLRMKVYNEHMDKTKPLWTMTSVFNKSQDAKRHL